MVQYLRAIRRHLLLIGITVGVALVAAFLLVSTAQKQYTASADIAINPISAGDSTFQGFDLFSEATDGSSTVVTAASVFNSPPIRDAVSKALGDAAGDASISVSPVSQSDIIKVTAVAPTAAEAARAANVFATTAVGVRSATFKSELTQRLRSITNQIAAIPRSVRNGNYEYAALAQQLAGLSVYKGGGDPTVRVLSEATPPDSPSWPRPKLTYAVALFAALLVGCGIALLLEFFNPRVTDETELILEQRLPVLARVPLLPQRVIRAYLSGQKRLPDATWKSYRTLRAVLATQGIDGHFPSSILVTSSSSGDGKTMTAANLAITLAASDLNVILVDADLYRPMVSTMFNRPSRGRDVVEALERPETAMMALVDSPAHPRLSLLLANRRSDVPLHLLDGQRFAALLRELGRMADVVVIDSPPIPEVAETLDLAAVAEVVLLCVRFRHTRREKLNQLREMMARRGVAATGFVVTTKVRATSDDAYEYGQAPAKVGLGDLTETSRVI
jgi:Mrp family chromosome partitioning ATPase/capsular polysaccharide biosynthesis protein